MHLPISADSVADVHTSEVESVMRGHTLTRASSEEAIWIDIILEPILCHVLRLFFLPAAVDVQWSPF